MGVIGLQYGNRKDIEMQLFPLFFELPRFSLNYSDFWEERL